MQLKTSRGVQQEEIWEAADTLLAAGLRPTIERVRQHLGRGSPNTVAPMLETWFAGLGKRLGMTGDQADDIPPAATQAMAKLWSAALLAARKEVDTALAQEKLTLETANAALSERESSLVQQEQAFSQRQIIVDALLQAERDKTAGVEAHLAASQEQLRQHDRAIIKLRGALAAEQDLLQVTRNQGDEQARRHAGDRGKFEERAAGNERRLLAEIDRERLVSKQAKAEAAEAGDRFQTILSNFQNRVVTLGQNLHVSEMELGIARNAFEISERRCSELSGLLQEQRASSTEALEKLNQTIADVTRKSTPAKRKAIRTTGPT